MNQGFFFHNKDLQYKFNRNLSFIRDNYPGNPLLNGKFLNEARKGDLSWRVVLRWYLSRNPQKKEKKADPFRLTVHDGSTAVKDGRDMILWLGHASFLIRMNGFTILTDPCLFDLPFIRRDAALPITLNDIGHIDYLLLSHCHRDHFDRRSLRSLDFRGTKALIPLEMLPLLKRHVPGLAAEEAGWYQRYRTSDAAPEIILLPAQHWSNRLLHDTNRVLWGSFFIRGSKRSVFFTGDSAYGPHFAEIKKHMGPADICLMPVGAYKPDYIMQYNHMTPEESVQAYRDLEGRIFFPMHYATYDLSDEPPGEPVRILGPMALKGEIPGNYMPLAVGEPLYF